MDIESILPEATEDDLRAIGDWTKDEPEAVLRTAIYSNDPIFTGLVNGVPVCMFGSYQPSLMENKIVVWMLGCNRLRKHPKLLMRYAYKILDELGRGYNQIVAMMDPEYEAAMRWVKRLGFVEDKPINCHYIQMKRER
jgi:hypothetical protein